MAKLVPLFLVAIAGSFYLLAGHKAAPVLPGGAGAGAWLKACLLLVFAYGGFETALTPLSEAKNPRRDAAFALFTALITCTLLYSAIQWVVVGILPDPAHSERPLADVARLVFGNGGAAFVSVGALVSVYGYLSANMLGVPRITFALAENGDFPSIFAAIHPRFRTPYVSILAFALLSWLLALLGSFTWNATLVRGGATALLRTGLRGLAGISPQAAGRCDVSPSAGTLFAVLGTGICAVLITGVNLGGSLILLATALVAFAELAAGAARKQALHLSSAYQSLSCEARASVILGSCDAPRAKAARLRRSMKLQISSSPLLCGVSLLASAQQASSSAGEFS